MREPGGGRRWTRRRKIVLASFAAVLILVGAGAIGATFYVDSLDGITPDKIPTAQVTAIMASDGKTQIAQLGTENRVDIDVTMLDPKVQRALIAAEDKNFYEHDGIAYTSILRAAFNNSTGGDKQGASTITQQYVKQATQRMEMSYQRKLREAVLARKLENTYSKDKILGFYLNTVWFGRNATGVERAALAYFGKPAKKLTWTEAAVLGAVIRNPEPEYLSDGSIDPNGFKGLDPELNLTDARDRWNYVLGNMAEKGWITEQEKSEAVYPTSLIPRATGIRSAEWGIKGVGTGNVINYVYEELDRAGISRQELKTGGYRVTTSIVPKIQKAAEDSVKGQLKGQPPTLMSALVAVDPPTGRVIAYYGGDDGTGHDYAGLNTEGGKLTGGHAPGSTMKVYTLAAALTDGISLASTWDAREIKKKDATHPYVVRNAGRSDAEVARKCPPSDCRLDVALVQSFNVPFYYVTQQIGPDKVLRAAQAAGIRHVWDNNGTAHALADQKGDWGRNPFDYPVGYGQYGITVLDHASGMATFADGGAYHTPHFVVSVEQRRLDGTYERLSQYDEKAQRTQAFPQDVANEVAGTMRKVPPTHTGWALEGGRDVAAKTGTWELNSTSRSNAHAWVVGFTKQIAVAVWVGNKGAEKAIKYSNGVDITSGTMPGDIWHTFLNQASRGMPKLSLPSAEGSVGSDDRGNGVPPSPSVSPSPAPTGSTEPCLPPEVCTSPSPSPKPPASPSHRPSPSRSPSPKG